MNKRVRRFMRSVEKEDGEGKGSESGEPKTSTVVETGLTLYFPYLLTFFLFLFLSSL